MASTPKQSYEQQPLNAQQRARNSGMINSSQSPTGDEREEEMSRSALAMFRAKEEEIERKKMEVRDKVHTYLGKVEEETKRLAEIREELESLTDPLRKDVAVIRKRIDIINKELKPLGQTFSFFFPFSFQLVTESEKLRMKKLEELSKNVDSLH